MNQKINTESEIIDIVNEFGTLYQPKGALVFYENENNDKDIYIEYFDMHDNGNHVNAHPLAVREAQRLSKSLNIQNKKDKDFLKPNGIVSPTYSLYRFFRGWESRMVYDSAGKRSVLY